MSTSEETAHALSRNALERRIAKHSAKAARACQSLSQKKITLHSLRHSTGFKLANDGQATRAVQHYLGHKNIQHTVRYTELSANRFNGFWQD